MDTKEVFKNPQLSLAQLALDLDVTPKELSRHINDVHQKNFSEYLNMHRVESVKKLLTSEEAQKYTLITLAESAGFSSKSSFNAIFKKSTGITPSAYKKQSPSI
jgi:AraC-like DNA-binding protein